MSSGRIRRALDEYLAEMEMPLDEASHPRALGADTGTGRPPRLTNCTLERLAALFRS